MPQKPIGPTFGAELSAAGLLGKNFSWSVDGTIEFNGPISDADRAAVLAVYAAHDPTKPDPSAIAAQTISAGCQIASTGTPALNGTYPIDPTSQSKIQATALYIQVNGKFPAGKTALPWADVDGAAHAFASTAQFMAFATVIGDYVTELEMVMIGQESALPAQPVTIA